MNEDVACRADDLTAVAEGQVWQKLLLGSGGTYEVAWDTAAVTPMGSLVYFAQYLDAGGLLNWCQANCPHRVDDQPEAGVGLKLLNRPLVPLLTFVGKDVNDYIGGP
jgi:hypothetical protein